MLKNIFIFTILLCAYVNCVLCIVGGHIAATPPLDDPVVFVRVFSRDARVEGIRNTQNGIYTFLGIRYAEPPINANRFLRTEYNRLRGDVDATKFGPPCPQPDPTNPSKTIGSEDCLLLNVYTPQMPDENTGLPVIVWIHGGGFRYGSAAQYNPNPLAMKNVIVVPVQYRLGTLGVLGEGNRDFPGNVALFDMAAALRWVKDYISFFGGNPDNIKVMGHGSGATSAMHLSMSDISNDSITGVIAMSGTVATKFSLDEKPVQSTTEVAKINSCSTANETETVFCMRGRSADEIVTNDSKLQNARLAKTNFVKAMTGFVGTAPNVEIPNDLRGLPGFIVEDPKQVLINGTFKKIPLLCGVTRDETANGILPMEIEALFGTLDNFLGSLKPLIGLDLEQLGVDKLVGTLTGPLAKNLKLLPLNEFLKIPKGLALAEILTKLVKTTTDIFFNLPIFFTAKEWGSKAPAYLYSFEYDKGKKSGKQLLSGLPLVGKAINDQLVGHGDELGFLFELADIFGNPLNQTNAKSAQDAYVRDSFTTLIADFARIINGTKSTKPQSGLLGSLNLYDDNSFVKISDKVSVEKDFRLCELATLGLPSIPTVVKSCDALLPINSLANVLTKAVVVDNLVKDINLVQPARQLPSLPKLGLF